MTGWIEFTFSWYAIEFLFEFISKELTETSRTQEDITLLRRV